MHIVSLVDTCLIVHSPSPDLGMAAVRIVLFVWVAARGFEGLGKLHLLQEVIDGWMGVMPC